MILRRPLLNATSAVSASKVCIRNLQHSIPIRPVPKPIPFVPDHTTFLTAIGRDLNKFAPQIKSWEALFTLSSEQLKELGVEPPRKRRYLLAWLEKYRNGEYGIGGDCQHVTDGIAELKIVEAPVGSHPVPGMASRSAMATATHDPGMRRMVVNVPAGADEPIEPVESVKPVKGVVVKGVRTICGRGVESFKGAHKVNKARLRMQEGLWQYSQGHKVDGGERRQAEVRAKARAKENAAKNA